VLPQLSVTLDNSSGAAPTSWQVTISQKDPQGHSWATASPTGGTVPAGQSTTLTIRPITSLCKDMQGSAGPITYTITMSYSQSGQPGSQTVTDTVTPPA
jgi:hypothetical protein